MLTKGVARLILTLSGSLFANAYPEHLFDTGEVMLNYPTMGGASETELLFRTCGRTYPVAWSPSRGGALCST